MLNKYATIQRQEFINIVENVESRTQSTLRDMFVEYNQSAEHRFNNIETNMSAFREEHGARVDSIEQEGATMREQIAELQRQLSIQSTATPAQDTQSINPAQWDRIPASNILRVSATESTSLESINSKFASLCDTLNITSQQYTISGPPGDVGNKFTVVFNGAGILGENNANRVMSSFIEVDPDTNRRKHKTITVDTPTSRVATLYINRDRSEHQNATQFAGRALLRAVLQHTPLALHPKIHLLKDEAQVLIEGQPAMQATCHRKNKFEINKWDEIIRKHQIDFPNIRTQYFSNTAPRVVPWSSG